MEARLRAVESEQGTAAMRPAPPDRSTAYGAVLAGFFGPTWATGEWGMRNRRGADASGRYDLDHQAWAISVGWFLAGAMLAYSGKAGTWGRVKVADPVIRGGAGAWELKGRYEDVDHVELLTGGTGYAWALGAGRELVSQRLQLRDVRSDPLAEPQAQWHRAGQGRGDHLQYPPAGGLPASACRILRAACAD